MSDKCPRCGAERKSHSRGQDYGAEWSYDHDEYQCGSWFQVWRDGDHKGDIRQRSISPDCLRRQLAAAQEAFLESMERETKLELICQQYYEMWRRRDKAVVPDLPEEKAVYDAGWRGEINRSEGRRQEIAKLKAEQDRLYETLNAAEKVQRELKAKISHTEARRRADNAINQEAHESLSRTIGEVSAERDRLKAELAKAQADPLLEGAVNICRIVGPPIGGSETAKAAMQIVADYDARQQEARNAKP